MLETLAEDIEVGFRAQTPLRDEIQAACRKHPELATFRDLGESEEGRLIYGVELGRGPRTVSLIAGAHADEPVGPETLRTMILQILRDPGRLDALFSRVRLVIIPHINPDGEARNRPWITRWPSLEAYLTETVRERPGRDLEFGFPAMRPENRVVASFLRSHAPFHLHMSLHGMGFAEGAMLLIERHWAFRTQALRDRFTRAVLAEGMGLHDHNRKGEKGFFAIEPGYTTTPEGAAMRHFFRAKDEPETAALFHDSSMEFVRGLGGDPLCLVTEIPLFLVDPPAEPSQPGVPSAYLAFKAQLPTFQQQALQGRALTAARTAFGLQPVPLRSAMRLQLKAIELGLEAVLD